MLETIKQARLLDIVPDAKDNEALAYTAGIIDGEGHLGIHHVVKPNLSYTCVAIVRMTERVALDFLVRNFGGSVGKYANKDGGKDIFQWRLYGVKAYSFIKYIKPWLKVKATQADIIIDFHEHYSFPKIGRKKPKFTQKIAEEAIIKLNSSN